MKQVALLLALTLALCAPLALSQTSAGSVALLPLPKNTALLPGNTDAGATWAASQTHYSAPFPIYLTDSVQFTFYFPDSANVDVKIQYAFDQTFTSPLDSSGSIVSDSILAGASGILKTVTTAGIASNIKAPFARLKYSFKATKNHAQGYDAYERYKTVARLFYRVNK